jgi:hypothetical protein
LSFTSTDSVVLAPLKGGVLLALPHSSHENATGAFHVSQQKQQQRTVGDPSGVLPPLPLFDLGQVSFDGCWVVLLIQMIFALTKSILCFYQASFAVHLLSRF